MKNKLLIVTKHNEDFSSILETNYHNYNIIWLQLWPVLNTAELLKWYPKISVYNPMDFIDNENHYLIANEVTNISNNWWSLLGFNQEYGDEWNLEGLKISQIFAYDLEQVLTNTMFQITAIDNAIEKLKPKDLLFVDVQERDNSGNEIWEKFRYFSLKPFFANNNKIVNVSQVFIDGSSIHKKNVFYEKTGKIFSSPDLLLKRARQKLFKEKLKSNSIIISNTDRCLHKFYDVAIKYYPVFILKHYVPDRPQNDTQYLKQSKELFFNNISLKPFFDVFLPVVEKRYHNLRILFYKYKEFARKVQPLLYVTVSMAGSDELVKLWAFKKSNVRVILAPEGLGQPNDDLRIAFNSIFHPEIDVERWLTSEFFKKTYFKNAKFTKVTGYLDRTINTQSKRDLKVKKQVVFALSIVNPIAKRAIIGEDIFEMLKSIRDVAEVMRDYPDYKLIIKLHPGDYGNIPLFKQHVLPINRKFKIIVNGNLNKIINESAFLIVYDTSVALESLYRNKNVISYNYVNRKNFMTSIYDHVNHNPEKGTAMIMANSIEELKKAVNKFMLHSGKTKPTPGLEHILENAKKDYNVERIVKGLVTNE